jgi:hypothetical protein
MKYRLSGLRQALHFDDLFKGLFQKAGPTTKMLTCQKLSKTSLSARIRLVRSTLPK